MLGERANMRPSASVRHRQPLLLAHHNGERAKILLDPKAAKHKDDEASSYSLHGRPISSVPNDQPLLRASMLQVSLDLKIRRHYALSCQHESTEDYRHSYYPRTSKARALVVRTRARH